MDIKEFARSRIKEQGVGNKLCLFPYVGGKNKTVKEVVACFPNHRTFVDVFGGAGNIILNKPKSSVEIYNDIDHRIVNFLRVLKDPVKYEKFMRQISLTPNSREEFYLARAKLQEGSYADEIDFAVATFVLFRQSFSGNGSSWGVNVSSVAYGINKMVGCYLSAIQKLPEVATRLMTVQIENNDFRKIFEIYDHEDVLLYCDPPYLPSTRKAQKVYKNEMSEQDHLELLNLAVKAKAYVVISGYESDMYNTLITEHGWQVFTKEQPLSMFPRKTGENTQLESRVECIYVSPKSLERLENGSGNQG